MHDLADTRILVTGAASGIGAAATRLLAGAGAELIVMDRDAQGLAAFPDATHLVGDVASPTLWADADLSGLTHAVINAGIGAGGTPLADLPFEEWRRVMDVNLDGAFLSLQAAIRAIRDGGKGGAIVVTASVAGMKAERFIGPYAAGKAALIQLARVAAKECAPDIRINAIAPGGTETAIWSKQPFFEELARAQGSEEAAYRTMASQATPLGRFAKPEEIAAQIAFLLSEDCAFTTGSVLVSDGGYSL
jgi:NAD(P)-dependent dehydrogenase (short-subunit alcohol dehydrogenase family)